MKIGILQCDPGTEGLWEKFGKFQDMIEASFKAISPNLTFEVYDLMSSKFPKHIDDCDAYVITGSRYSAYEQTKWMLKLEALIQEMNEKKKKCVGICYGHQIMAKALGGKVEKSTNGWGVGVMTHEIYEPESWMQPPKKVIATVVSHQDQVIALPKSAKLIAGSEFCPNYWLSYGKHFTSLQGHPEFCKEFARALLDKKETISKQRVEEAKASMGQPVDSDLVNRWLVQFITA